MNLITCSSGYYGICLLLTVLICHIQILEAFYVNLSPDEEVSSLLRKLTENLDEGGSYKDYYSRKLPLYRSDDYIESKPELLTIIQGDANHLGQEEKPDTIISVNKRYTVAQDSASDYCTGQCMYLERLPYSKCYGLCHWTGSGPSPWVAYYKEKADNEKQAALRSRDMASMVYRTGMDNEQDWNEPKWETEPSGTKHPGRTRQPLGKSVHDNQNATARQLKKMKGRRLKMVPKSSVNASQATSRANNDSNGSSSSSSTNQNKHSNKCSCNNS